MRKYRDLYELLRHEQEAKRYFERLPGYVRDQIGARADGVNSFSSLQDYVENLTRGDG